MICFSVLSVVKKYLLGLGIARLSYLFPGSILNISTAGQTKNLLFHLTLHIKNIIWFRHNQYSGYLRDLGILFTRSATISMATAPSPTGMTAYK